MNTTIIEPAQVAAGHTEVNTPNLNIGHLLGLDDCVADVLFGHWRVANFPLTNTTRARLTQSNNVQRAIRAEVADDSADFGSADFQSDDNRRGRIKHVFSLCVM